MIIIWKFGWKGEDCSGGGLVAAWGGDVRGASRARGARKRVGGGGGRGRGSDGPALGPHAPAPAHAPARGPSAHRPPSLEPRSGRGRPLLRAERRHDVLLARLRRSRISTRLPLWFVFFFFYCFLSSFPFFTTFSSHFFSITLKRCKVMLQTCIRLWFIFCIYLLYFCVFPVFSIV